MDYKLQYEISDFFYVNLKISRNNLEMTFRGFKNNVENDYNLNCFPLRNLHFFPDHKSRLKSNALLCIF
jgi:hypothetical protein